MQIELVFLNTTVAGLIDKYIHIFLQKTEQKRVNNSDTSIIQI